jgi:hypothetical protein
MDDRMNVDDEHVRRIYQEAHAVTDAGCLEQEQLVKAATGELTRAEREPVMDHLGVCARCAAEYRLLASIGPWAEESAASVTPAISMWSWRARDWALAAAALVLVVGLGAQVAYLQRQNELLRSGGGAGAPQVNVPIVDLEPRDALRGGQRAVRTVELPADATIVMLVLATTERDADYELEISSGSGEVVWAGAGLKRTPLGTINLTLPKALLPSGTATLRLYAVRNGERAIADQYSVEFMAP